ncbi:hypothetical protein CapIbe_000073 [Capra ibex]
MKRGNRRLDSGDLPDPGTEPPFPAWQINKQKPERLSNSCKVTWWKVKVKSLSHVGLFVTPWTVAHQVPPSMGFSRT